MVCLPSRGSCLPLSPIVPLLVSLCWMVCPPSRGSCLPVSRIVPLLHSLCWMVCPPSRGSCLPLSPIVPLLFLILGPPMLGLWFVWDLCWAYVGELGSWGLCWPHVGHIFGQERRCSKRNSPFLGYGPTLGSCWYIPVGYSPNSVLLSVRTTFVGVRLGGGWCVCLSEVLSPRVSPHVCLCSMVWPPS